MFFQLIFFLFFTFSSLVLSTPSWPLSFNGRLYYNLNNTETKVNTSLLYAFNIDKENIFSAVMNLNSALLRNEYWKLDKNEKFVVIGDNCTKEEINQQKFLYFFLDISNSTLKNPNQDCYDLVLGNTDCSM